MTIMNVKQIIAAAFTLILFFPVLNLWAASIMDSKHNLSVSGPGPVKSVTESRICIFCHTPHQARRDVPYLWNRADSTINYTTYESSTLHATVGQPSGASKMCLSCHDGTIALGSVLSRTGEIPFAGGIRFLPEGDTLIGADISDDHPVSFVYDEALAAANGELAPPSGLNNEVKLDKSNLLQCTACHDPHIDVYGKFLVKPNKFSALCTTCHQRTDWEISSHAVSVAVWNGAGTDPWQHTPYTTVNENGCENCHRPHAAGGHARLLNYAIEEDNCLVCHSGNVAVKDIETELVKPYAHPVQDYTGVHDAAEDFTSLVSKHVECVDCHNPHRVDNSAAVAPDVPGPLRGVKGISESGTPVAESAFTYEICFKCHASPSTTTCPARARRSPPSSSRPRRLSIRTGSEPTKLYPVGETEAASNVRSWLRSEVPAMSGVRPLIPQQATFFGRCRLSC